MQLSKWNIVAIIGVTFALVFVCLVLQFNDAANAIAAFKTEGMTGGNGSSKVEKLLREYGGVSSLQVDPQKGIVIAVFDSRGVDPRKVAGAITGIGFPTRIIDLMTMKQYIARVSGGAGCGSGGCGDCSKTR